MASPALARESPEKLLIRTLTLPIGPTWDHPLPICVSGQVVTTLRFEMDVDPAKTKFTGWEGRFEPPLVGGNKVVLVPLHNLGSGEALPLLVRLVDGTQFTFLVKASDDAGWIDVQLNVFKNRDTYDEVVSDLLETKTRERDLREENNQLKEEAISGDYALATLLANSEENETSLKQVRAVHPKNGDMNVLINLYSGPGKAAAVVQMTNARRSAPWNFESATLTREFPDRTARPFALRVDMPVIVPGATGTIAVVVDESAFKADDGKLSDLALRIFGDGGVQQVAVALDHTLIRK